MCTLLQLPPGLMAGDHSITPDVHEVYLFNVDTRRTIKVTLPNTSGCFAQPPDDDPNFEIPLLEAAKALRTHLDSGEVPPEAFTIEIDEAGKLLSFSTDLRHDYSKGTDYLLVDDYRLPPATVANQTILRSELTEVRRSLGGSIADVVSYPESLAPALGWDGTNGGYVFKPAISNTVALWTEVQFVARLPPHPNMVLLDRLVLDEATGKRVVGFTMRYVAGESLNRSRSLFKLKWLRQLMQAVDDLNLKHGVIHQDIADRNLLIDSDTDSILLIDFGCASRIGSIPKLTRERCWEERDDVKGILAFVYEFITRDPTLARYDLDLVDEKGLRDPAKWIKHPDVELDHDVEDFRSEVLAWARTRRAGKALTHHGEAPEPLHWPNVPKKAWQMNDAVSNWRKKGRSYVHWERPAFLALDPNRRLLATGRYADEEAANRRTRKAAGAGVGGKARPRREAASPKAAGKEAVVGGTTRPRRAAASQKAASKEVVGREPRPRRAAASQKAVSKEVIGRELHPRQAAATKKRKKDGDGGGDGGDAPESGVEVSPPTKRRSSRRGGAVLSVKP